MMLMKLMRMNGADNSDNDGDNNGDDDFHNDADHNQNADNW